MLRIILTYLLLSSISFGQDLRNEFVQMHIFLEKQESFEIKVNYSADDTQKVENGNVSVVATSDGLLYSFGAGVSLMINKENTVLIEPKEKQLVYSNNQKVKKQKSFTLVDKMLQGIDTLMVRCDTISFYKEGEQRVYNLRFDNAYFDLVQLYFLDNFISKAVYFYNDKFVDFSGAKTVCDLQLETSLEIDDQLFETTFYLKEEAGIMTASENFKNYKIVYNESLEEILD